MLPPGPALKVSIHLNVDTAATSDFLHEEILQVLLREKVAGATLLHLHAGFGGHHNVHTVGAPGVAGSHLPVRIEFIETREKVGRVMPLLAAMVNDGLIETQEVTVVKSAGGDGPGGPDGPGGDVAR